MRLIVLISLLLTLSCQKQERVSLLFIDSFLCPSDLNAKQRSKILNFEELRSNEPLDCARQIKEVPRAFHAQDVLIALLNDIEKPIAVYHQNVYDHQGRQSLRLWQQAIELIKTLKPSLVLSATGGLIPELFEQFTAQSLRAINTPWIIAAGQPGPGVSRQTRLWPHEHIEDRRSSLILVGSTVGENLYEEKIRLRHSKPGTSQAAAFWAAQAINHCLPRSFTRLERCLSKIP